MQSALVSAYRKTAYKTGDITVRTGHRCAGLDLLLRKQRKRAAIFITAHNPFSLRMPSGWNDRMQTRMFEALRRYQTLPAEGRWKAWSERHFLVFSDLPPMRQLARRFRQNGIVIVRLGQPAKLILFPLYSVRNHAFPDAST